MKSDGAAIKSQGYRVAAKISEDQHLPAGERFVWAVDRFVWTGPLGLGAGKFHALDGSVQTKCLNRFWLCSGWFLKTRQSIMCLPRRNSGYSRGS